MINLMVGIPIVCCWLFTEIRPASSFIYLPRQLSSTILYFVHPFHRPLASSYQRSSDGRIVAEARRDGTSPRQATRRGNRKTNFDLKNKKKKISSADVDGTGARGVILQGVVLLICLWLFSIPPEFRRAHFCTTDQCVTDRAKCYDCVTFSEFQRGSRLLSARRWYPI